MPTKLVDGVRIELTQDEIDEIQADEAIERALTESFKPDLIKKEAMRRILEVAPEHTQRNMIAKGVELLEKLVLGETLSTEELVFRNAAMQKWKDIETIRAKSNTLEKMDPIPDDYRDDKYWT